MPPEGPRSTPPGVKSTRYDVIIIGGGHNGLVTANDLQRAGLQTLVLEAKPQVGGACVTEEVFPGYQVSTAAYVCSLLRPQIVRDLELEKHGLSFIERDPSSFTPFPDGRSLTFWGDQQKTCEEIAKFSKKDAARYPEYEALLGEIANFIDPILDLTPPDLLSPSLSDLWDLGRLGLGARKLGPALYDKLRLLATNASDFLDRYFESDELKSTLAIDGVIGAFAAPSTPGTAYLLLHHVMGETFGRKGVWAYVRGGMGGITQAMARSLQASGGEIRVNSRVAKILTTGGRACGVVLDSGEELLATAVASNADPKRTFLDMLESGTLSPEFVREVQGIQFRSASFKLNLALGGVPNFTALPTPNGEPGAHHRGTIHICPSTAYMEQAYLDARQGKPSERPVLDCTMASVVDPSLCPPGKHLMSLFVQYAPYELAEGSWTAERKAAFAKRCITCVDEYAPGFANLVEGVHSLSPVDLEREFGLTGGSISHGDMTLDQLFFMRPIPACARYRTPLKGLYLCGSGTHPGGGVMGASGRNAAREMLKDLMR